MAKYDPNKHHRRSIRLKNYDYASAGAYFVTICVQHRQPLFGTIVNQTMVLNDAGIMVQTIWESLPKWFPHIEMDEFVVMPNHFHGILVIHAGHNVGTSDHNTGTSDHNVGVSLVDTPMDAPDTPDRATTRVAPTLGNMIGAFKSITTHQYIQGVRQKDWPPFDGRLWQRNYWEHIIRDEQSLHRIRNYIQSNPISWEQDSLHPTANRKKE